MEVAAIVTTIKAIAGVAKEAGKIELYQQIIDLQQAILDAIGENTKLVAENAQITRELAEARLQLDEMRHARARLDDLAFRNDAYWRMTDGKTTDGPFCPKCLDADGKLLRMVDRGNGFTCCVNCHYCINTPGYIPPPAPPRMVPLDDY